MLDISDVMYIRPSYGLSSRGFTIDADMLAITLGILYKVQYCNLSASEIHVPLGIYLVFPSLTSTFPNPALAVPLSPAELLSS